MATLVYRLALLCLFNLIPPSESITPDRRSEEVYDKYILYDGAGGARSQLFSQCMADARTVEGVLYSIAVTDDEKYVRFAPVEKMEFQWTMVDLGDGDDIIDCAQKAYELGGYMFKFDGSCNVALTSSYDPKSEQACDGAATEVVYITSRPFNVLDGEVVLAGESRGCLYSSPEGMRYDNEVGMLVDEAELPPPDVCSPTATEGYHLVAECLLRGMSFCEAQARCEARGLPLASKSFYDEFAKFEDFSSISSDVAELLSSIGVINVWVNIQKINDTWQWMPDMVAIPESDFSAPIQSGQACGLVTVHDTEESKIESWGCGTPLFCTYCHDSNSPLPEC